MIPIQALPPLQPWPPLITGARLPRWIAIRDVLLTILAWLVLAWLVRDSIYLLYDYLRPPVFILTGATLPDLAILWNRLRYFVLFAAGLILSLTFRAVIDRHRLMAATRLPQPLPLTISEQAAQAGLDESIIAQAREFKITNVLFHEDGTIAGFEELNRTKSAAALAQSLPPPSSV